VIWSVVDIVAVDTPTVALCMPVVGSGVGFGYVRGMVRPAVRGRGSEYGMTLWVARIQHIRLTFDRELRVTIRSRD
jgi:hypothetical protein